MSNVGLKKRFILVQSSSAPYATGQPIKLDNKVNLSDFSTFGYKRKDVLQVGLNAVAAERGTLDSEFGFGFSHDLLVKAGVGVEHFGTGYPEHTSGYAFSIGYFDSGRFEVYSISDLFTDSNSPLVNGDFTDRAQRQFQNHITASLEKKYEIIIAPIAPRNIPAIAIVGSYHDLYPVFPDWMKNENDWNTMILKNFDNKTYEDLSFTMDWPIRYEDVDQNIAASVREMYVKIKPSYNFYVKDYEKALIDRGEPGPHGQGFPVYMLPNIYMFASELEGGFRDPSRASAPSRFAKHITLNGLIPTTFIDIEKTMILPSGPTTVKIGELDTDQHFERFGRILGNILDYRIWLGGNEFDEYRNLIFPRSNLDLLKNHEGKEKLFPMHIEIEFTTDVNTRFADFLRNTNLTSVLMKYLIQNPDAERRGNWCTVDLPDSDSEDPRAQELENRIYKSYPVWDLVEWITTVSDQTLPQTWGSLFPFTEGTFMGEYTSEIRAAMEPQFQLFTLLMMHLFKGDVKSLVEDKARDFVDLLKNDLPGPQGNRKFAHSETIFYKIQKMTGKIEADSSISWSEESGRQDIYFPNSSDIDVLKYIDTQVMPNTPYRYKIWAYQLVIGNEYTYDVNRKIHRDGIVHTTDGEGGKDDDNLWNALCVFCKPSLKLIGVPIYDSRWDHSQGIIIQDSPPVPPDVRIVPYRGVDDKILIWLNGNVDDFEMAPQKIEADDFANYRNNAGNLPATIRFKSDDPVKEFEIWKLDSRPTYYSDFAKGEPIIPSHTVKGNNPVPTNSYIDKVQPNKKYYYTFRSRDVHGNISNPTVVYECELVKQDEFVYPIIRTIDMNKQPDIQTRKPFKKFLQIKPSFLQSALDTAALDTVALTHKDHKSPGAREAIGAEIQFDNPGSSVWEATPAPPAVVADKKYKIRLHSKKSGRKLDINIDFRIDTSVKDNTE